MYLNSFEKEHICKIIRKVLSERGGYWITADVYIKNKIKNLNLRIDEKQKKFFEAHNIEENKFNSFEEAESFFMNNGFVIDKEAQMEYSELSSLKFLAENTGKENLIKIKSREKIQTTWRLKLADG